jgi:hypothetical protein
MTSSKFVEGINTGLADRWIATLFTPAFVFWFGGILACIEWIGWKNAEAYFVTLSEPLQIALLVTALLVVTTSGFVVQQFDFTVLRMLEGYWPAWCNPVRARMQQRYEKQFERLENQMQRLYLKQHEEGLTPQEIQTFIQADIKFSRFPAQPIRLMPTRLGNILRAGEGRPRENYGLDAIICWPRFWLVLQENVRKELTDARNNLNLTARIWLLSVLFCGWSLIFWTAWPLAAGLASALFAYHWMLRTAMVYSDLLEATFDLHRFKLYEEMHWHLPTDPAEEHRLGKALTDYLWHGSDQPEPKFIHPE